MNYRKGFQRVYIALSFAWAVVALFALPTQRTIIWTPTVDYYALAERARRENPLPAASGVVSVDPAESTPQAGTIPAPPPGFHPVNEDWRIWTVPDKPHPPPPSRTTKALWLMAVLSIPPGIGYVLLFFVLPWIVRGFPNETRETKATGD